MGDALVVAAIVAFVGAFVALFFLPARARDPLVLQVNEERAAPEAEVAR